MRTYVTICTWIQHITDGWEERLLRDLQTEEKARSMLCVVSSPCVQLKSAVSAEFGLEGGIEFGHMASGRTSLAFGSRYV